MRTKLNTYQRKDLKIMKANAKRDRVRVFRFPFMGNGVTVAIKRTGDRMGAFSVSLASMDEDKFSKKVGQYHALDRFFSGQVLPVQLAITNEEHPYFDDALTEDETLEVTAEQIAHVLTR